MKTALRLSRGDVHACANGLLMVIVILIVPVRRVGKTAVYRD
jgi:hypothetical protein